MLINHGVLAVLIIGLALLRSAMAYRSVKDDLGYHIHKEELMNEQRG